jgi:putative ATP-dependent endonuclease of the OLD family
MKLSIFSVSKFRSITTAHKIKFSQVTTLIGKNNEGKSNFLKALQVAMQLIHSHANEDNIRRRILSSEKSPYQWARDYPIQLQDKKKTTNTIFKLDFTIDAIERADFKKLIGSTLNESLPVEIAVSKDNSVSVRLVKTGKGTKLLNNKSRLISKFITERINFNYIPAIRTENESLELIGNLVSEELRILENDSEYKDALNTIAKLQKPVLLKLSKELESPLKEFLPSIKSVEIEIADTSRRYALRRDVKVIVDDGTPTDIAYKGDGVKSLAALGLLKNLNKTSETSILAIEEPESHLHPGAINQVNDIIRSISENTQVVLTTHNPLFVNRGDIKSNIIISDGSATQAKNISNIREVLGVKASDNLINASFVLVVEGKNDAAIISQLIRTHSSKLASALRSNILVIEAIHGADKLKYHLTILKSQLCITHALLDYDEAGRQAFANAESANITKLAEVTFTKCIGMRNSELEDLINPDIYKNSFQHEFGIDVSSIASRNNQKWTERLKNIFEKYAVDFRAIDEKRAKLLVAESVIQNPSIALLENKREALDALIAKLEQLITV